MFRTGSLAASFAASMVILLFQTPLTAATPESGSSNAMLLSPRLRVGQSVRWIGDIGLWYYEKSSHSNVHRNMHSIAYTCVVEKKTADSLTMSREVSVFENDHHIPAEVTATNGHWINFHNFPPIVVREGQAFKTDSKPLQDDPLCLIYSTAWFGVPPATLSRGTTWKFITPAWIPSFKQFEHGVVTVKSVDSTTGVTVLSISLHPPTVQTVVERYDLSIDDGGLIRSETQRSEGPGYPGNSTFHYESVWALVR
jgi:hypothetical protein